MRNSGTVELFDESSITGNQATSYGGGIYNTGTITLWGSTSVTLNTATLLGGGIYNNAGDLTILPAASVTSNTPDDIYNVP
jgi:predicted outer membrane repeat protein